MKHQCTFLSVNCSPKVMVIAIPKKARRQETYLSSSILNDKRHTNCFVRYRISAILDHYRSEQHKSLKALPRRKSDTTWLHFGLPDSVDGYRHPNLNPVKTLDRRYWFSSIVFNVNFELILYIFQAFL